MGRNEASLNNAKLYTLCMSPSLPLAGTRRLMRKQDTKVDIKYPFETISFSKKF